MVGKGITIPSLMHTGILSKLEKVLICSLFIPNYAIASEIKSCASNLIFSSLGFIIAYTCNFEVIPWSKIDGALWSSYLAYRLEAHHLKVWHLEGRKGIAIPSLLPDEVLSEFDWDLSNTLDFPSCASTLDLRFKTLFSSIGLSLRYG